MMTTRDWSEMRILRAELLDAHRDLMRARTQAEQLIVSNRDLSSLLASASSQAGELLKVSVAFRRLSEAGDAAAAALWAVEDVAINVVGTEDFVLLACGPTARMHPIAGMGDAFDKALDSAPTLARASSIRRPRRSTSGLAGTSLVRSSSDACSSIDCL